MRQTGLIDDYGNTKLVATRLVGRRDGSDAMTFLLDLAPRLGNRVSINTARPHTALLIGILGPRPWPSAR